LVDPGSPTAQRSLRRPGKDKAKGGTFMIRVLLVDDHALVRTGIRRILELGGGIEVVGEARSGEEAVSLVPQLRPDVVLMDVTMPGMGGLEATHKLLRRDPSLRVAVVTVHESGPYPRRFLEAGALGYLHKGCDAEECQRAIRQVAAGQPYISQQVAQHLVLARGGPEDAFADLSDQEFEVLLRMTSGYTTEETANALFLSPKTVATYRSRIFRKLGVRSVVELTHLALRRGLIDSGVVDSVAGVREPAGPAAGDPTTRRRMG
jgi:two-component system invasion response regulator UvrY